MSIWFELRRRRVYRTIGLYIVGCWLVIQVAATFFPAWDIPATALRYVIFAAIAVFPVVVVFGWFFDITPQGIVRTDAADQADAESIRLRRFDFVILGALAIISGFLLYGGFDQLGDVEPNDASVPDKPPNSIAVLPFDNLDSRNEDTAFFSDGVTEEVLHRLASFDSLRVIGRTSSFAFKNAEMTIPRISDALGVRYLLQGSVRRDADQIRITATLVDDAGFQLWSRTFDRELEGVFQVQSEIAHAVARQLVEEIAPQDIGIAATTRNMDAYQAYLVGRDHMNRRVAGWRAAASDAFRQSITLDPNFAPPYAGLALATIVNAGLSPDTFADNVQFTRTNVARALDLDPDLADAYAARGLLLLSDIERDFPAAEAAFRRAIDLDSSFASAYNWLSIALSSQGRHEESWDTLQRALAVDPLNPIINTNIALRYQGMGDFGRAEEMHLRLLDLPDPPGVAHISLLTLYRDYGRYVEATRSAKNAAVTFHRQQQNIGFSSLATCTTWWVWMR